MSRRKGSGKVRRTERFRYLVADPAGAEDELGEARLAELRARGSEGHRAAVERLRAAERAVEDCYATVRLQALAPSVHEAFVHEFAGRQAAHDAAVAEAEEAGESAPVEPRPDWSADSVEVRFLAACDLDAEHDAAWWAEEFASDEWTLAERDELLSLCYRVNAPRRVDFGLLGKG